MAKVFNSITDVIGNTPLVRLNKVQGSSKHNFWLKLEYFNPGGSIKDRIGQAIIDDAEKKGLLKPGGTIVEATAGNTGIGLAQFARLRGYRCIFVMPDKMSEEKRSILRAYGAELVITPSNVDHDHPESYMSVAKRLSQEIPNAILGNQYHNPANKEIHYKWTGPEIWNQTDGEVDVFVAGAGTGGTISGVGKYLKEKKKDVKIVCADPVGSILADLFNYGKVITPASGYKVEGVGEDMLPDNVVFSSIDAFEKVNDIEAFQMTRRLVAEESILIGPSSALILVGAMKYAEKLEKPSNIVVMCPDSGRAYLSKAFNEEWLRSNGLI